MALVDCCVGVIGTEQFIFYYISNTPQCLQYHSFRLYSITKGIKEITVVLSMRLRMI